MTNHNCICAHPDHAILEFYRGYFDTVYIALSPFQQVTTGQTHLKYVSWEEVIRLTGFSDINQLDVALRSAIYGLNDTRKNDYDANHLKAVCDANNLLIPGEGYFQDSIKDEMLLSLQEQGHHYMFVGDEHGLERKAVFIQDMIDGTATVELEYAGHENWYTTKHEILYTTHWDSFYTLLCSNRQTVDSILENHRFEGFYCDDKTTIYWSLGDIR
ncbi:DUF2711 family protein [Desertivirga xinjiangensis]|uniref:DUF2711 family protein n=1 Tax=Desertivirga xinjiangensis TaxID=539206 RepID=UPI00210EBA41